MKMNEAKLRKCMNWGHDWAIKDNEQFLTKVCMRCGAEQHFFAVEEDEDDDI